MSLLKSSSNTKLDEVLGEECKDLPGVVLVRCHRLVKHLYKETEEPRRRIRFQLKKNSFRLLVSLLAVVWQLYWFSAYYIHDNAADSVAVGCEKVDGRKLTIPSSFSIDDDNLDADESLVLVGNTSLDSSGLGYCSRTGGPKWKNHANYNHQHQRSPSSPPEDDYQLEDNQSEVILWPKVSTLLEIMWKVFMLLKLICLMAFFEMLRLLDTIWTSLAKGDDDDDEARKNAKKSPVDVRYIERNRGYK